MVLGPAKKHVNDFVVEAARRAVCFDESNIAYEAARLSSVPCVVVFANVFAPTVECFVAKGDDEVRSLLRGEKESIECESLLALDKNSAYALRRALSLRLVK